MTKLTCAATLEHLSPTLSSMVDADIFCQRFEQMYPFLIERLSTLYRGAGFDEHFLAIMKTAVRMFQERRPTLKEFDLKRQKNPYWYQSESTIGAVCYVDLFAGNLIQLQQKIPYLKELKITYLHLMPLYQSPEGNSDGGYAISNYRSVNPKLGTMTQLTALADELRQHNISLVLDFAINHTSDEHIWALKAKDGAPEYQDFYFLFSDFSTPERYELNLRQIFPEESPDNFTFIPEISKWAWTTFYPFQWDLNYKNPAVFRAILEEILFLANQGVEVLRLDAAAFIWKQLGTPCENLPQVHLIIEALNALVKIVAPSLLFKSEVIVHPSELIRYMSWSESPITYNHVLTASLWEALATREVRLLHHALEKRLTLPAECTWVNYVRNHDDVGWSFANEDALEIGINPVDHRTFLNQFYTGRFSGSFARGLPFSFDQNDGNMRIAGTTASLAGLEQAIEIDQPLYIDHALKRIVLLHSIIMSIGGIPLIYLGDEIAACNDYSYRLDDSKKDDSRWVHRPFFDWSIAQNLCQRPRQQHVRDNLIKLITLRSQQPELGNGTTELIDVGNQHVFCYLRNHAILIISNFSEKPQIVAKSNLPKMSVKTVDIFSGDLLSEQTDVITLEPYQFLWLKKEK